MSDPLAPIRARFVARCREDLALVGAGPSPELPGAVHKLAGLAGTLGYAELGQAAVAADDALAAGRDPAAELAALKAALQAFLVTHG